MKEKRLSDLIGSIDEDLIEDADKTPVKRHYVNKTLIISLSSAAACLILLFSVLYYFRGKDIFHAPEVKPETSATTEVTVISETEPSDPISIITSDECNAGLEVSLQINEEGYEDYAFSSVYKIAREENGQFVDCEPIDDQKDIQYFIAPEKTSSSVILAEDNMSMVIFWQNELGSLSPGRYEITCYAISPNNSEIIPVTTVFEIPPES